MKIVRKIVSVMMILTSLSSQAQKTLSEGLLLYNIAINTDNKEPKAAAMDGATYQVLIRGAQSRTDMVSTLGTETTVYDSKTGNAFILKEYSGQKLMITLTKDDWNEKGKTLSDINFETTSATKVIAGYNCKQAIGKTGNGTVFTVYYTPDVMVTNKDYTTVFKKLPGLPVEFEINTGKMIFKYTLAKINFDPVPSSKFEMPKSGYRIMTYEENKKLKNNSN